MMGSVLKLESFDNDGVTAITHSQSVSAKPEGYEQGYADGLAAAEAQLALDQSHLTNELVASVSENAAHQLNREDELISAVQPLLNAMIDTLLPAALVPALHAHLANLVQTALLEDARMPITLRVAPNQCAKVQEALSGLDIAHLEILPDPNLTEACAWVTTAKGETSLDFDAALTAIEAQIAALHKTFEENSESASHG